MKIYKGKWSTMLYWILAALFGSWFVYNIMLRLTHSISISALVALILIAGILAKVLYYDNIIIEVSPSGKLFVKRFDRIINQFELKNFYISEYPKGINVKNEDEQYIYFVSKKNGEEDFIDCDNFSSDEYERLLQDIGAKNSDEQPITIKTTKK